MTVLQDRPIFEDDYPTGPIDFHNPDDPFVRAMLEAESQEQPREANGRFGFKDKPLEYTHLLVPTADNPVVEVRQNVFEVYAPKCPHGHFAHWAKGNCRRCNGTRGENECNGSREDGEPCTRKTTYRKPTDQSIPLCHQHGGRKP